MRLGVKHENQFQIVHADFSGGLNTSNSDDSIAENQLSQAVNVEIDHATGKLKTVAGTTDILNFGASSAKIVAAMYDAINKKVLLVREIISGDSAVRSVLAVDFVNDTVSSTLGNLSGDLYPICASWENGILIATGGKLQYFDGTALNTITNSPNASCVYVRDGRVLVTDENNLWYSGVGDEEKWEENTNDDSSAKFTEIGYKDGGQLLATAELSNDVLMVKDNRRMYRLNGKYPDWVISEISRNVEVRGRMGICSVADLVFILGSDEVQNIQAEASYGNMKPQDVATLITSEVRSLAEDTILRYLPKLNQVWAISGEVVLVYDLITQSWYKRKFNSPIVDVLCVDNEIFVIKKDRVSKLDETTFNDSGASLSWEFKCKTRVSQHDYLLKRTQVLFIPQDDTLTDGKILVGKVNVTLTTTTGDSSTRRQSVCNSTILAQSRNVFRTKCLEISGNGSGGGIIFNSIILDVVEV